MVGFLFALSWVVASASWVVASASWVGCGLGLVGCGLVNIPETLSQLIQNMITETRRNRSNGEIRKIVSASLKPRKLVDHEQMNVYPISNMIQSFPRILLCTYIIILRFELKTKHNKYAL